MKDYTDITNRVKSILEGHREAALSADLSKAVVAVRKGQYVPNSADSKPCVYIRFCESGVIASMAGGLKRQERPKFLISGAVVGTTQEAAIDDASNLISNIANILENNMRNDMWGAGRLGWSYSEDDSRDEPTCKITPDPGSDNCVVHFQIRWSCDVMIRREPV
jgi:hypothetical protein